MIQNGGVTALGIGVSFVDRDEYVGETQNTGEGEGFVPFRRFQIIQKIRRHG